MTSETHTIQVAEFNPRIKQYITIVVGLIMFATIIGIPILIIWLLGLGPYFSRRYYENLECKLTNRHLEYRKGVFFKVEKTIPLENIQDLTFIQNPILNYFDLRILKIETAGSSNPKGSDMSLIGIIGMADFKKSVLKQRAVLIAEDKKDGSATADQDKQIIDLLTDIRGLLSEMKNKG